MMMKRSILFALSLVLAVSMTACGSAADTQPAADPSTVPTAQETVQIPNPWQECTTVEQAAEAAGFPFDTPDAVDGYTEKNIAVIPGDISEVKFRTDDDDASEVCFRKGTGTGDISGDYNSYETTQVSDLDGKRVTCRGSGDLIYTAFWEADGFAYSVSATAGMTAGQLAAWAARLN